MADVTVRFLHPSNGGSIEAAIDDEMTAAEAIRELVTAGFVPTNPDGYILARKEGGDIHEGQTFRAAGVREGGVVRVMPGTLAGA